MAQKEPTGAPFIFGIRVRGDNFTDRKEETNRLRENFLHGVNTILISPRRMGKTSLVEKVCSTIDNQGVKIAHMDAFGCRSEADFVNAFATAVIKATSTRLEEWIANARTFLGRIVPKVSFGQDPLNEFSVTLDFDNTTVKTEEVLKMPELIASTRGYRIVICIDEFQQIGEFADSLTFQKKLRSVWQLQTNVSYCLYGSKKHIMETIFQNRSHPFYRFGDIIYLGKISEDDWVEYICRRFEVTGKAISADLARQICRTTECYSSYVQQLAWFVWLRADGNATADDLRHGIDMLIDTCEPLFILQTEKLSEYQMNFLHAIADGVHTGFSRSEVMKRYRFGTAPNIVRLKKTLIAADIITSTAPRMLSMSDPILSLWLKMRVWGR